jgi:hypothetical protein
VRLALIAKTARWDIRRCSTAKNWGFYDVLFKGNAFKFQRPYGSYVMENVLFKISFPAEFHAQTAVECAMQLHPLVRTACADIEEDHDPHARIGASASSTRRGRSTIRRTATICHPVHGCRAHDPRTADGRRLRGQTSRATAHRRAAREDGLHRGQASSRRTTTIPTSARSPTRSPMKFKDGTQARRNASSNIRSAIGAAARKACRC